MKKYGKKAKIDYQNDPKANQPTLQILFLMLFYICIYTSNISTLHK